MPRPRLAATALAALLAVIAVVIGAEEVRVAGDAIERPGVAAFYAQPSPVPAGEPGALVKSEELIGVPPGARAWRIMYHSRDLNGADVVVTGILVVPLAPPPPDGRTVLAWSHPTTGAAPSCAPSYGFDPFLTIEGLRAFLDRGYAVVATDYAGMGTAGPDSYLVGATEGDNVLDAVRAARAMPVTAAGDRVVLWGHSQGGQAALFAAERASAYAPELRVEAVAVAAPAADLEALVGAHLDDISGVTIGSYAFTAYASVYGGEPGVRLAGILTPEAIALLPRMNALCLLTDLSELHRMGTPLVGRFFTADPTTTQPWAGLLAQNSAGSVPFGAPLFVAQGLADTLVVPADTAEFVRHEQASGMDVTYRTVGFADHGTIAYLALPDMLHWLDQHVARR